MLLKNIVIPLSCLLFDMDGTLIDSHAPMIRAYTAWASRYGLDPMTVVDAAQGRRTIDTIRLLAPAGADVTADAAWVARREREDLEGVIALPGVVDFVTSIPPGRWAVVTSADRGLAAARLRAAGLPLPSLLIGAEDVMNGKPAPDGYQRAARELGADARAAVVFEDAPAGLEAGKAAGARVIAIATTLTSQALTDLGQEHIADMRPLSLAGVGEHWRLRIA